MQDEFALYDTVERIAPKLISEHRRTFKTVCANVDFYSGFVYTMLKLPIEIFTPIFAISRISGWSAHRIEELVNNVQTVFFYLYFMTKTGLSFLRWKVGCVSIACIKLGRNV